MVGIRGKPRERGTPRPAGTTQARHLRLPSDATDGEPVAAVIVILRIPIARVRVQVVRIGTRRRGSRPVVHIVSLIVQATIGIVVA